MSRMGATSSAERTPAEAQPQPSTQSPQKRTINKITIDPKPVQFAKFVTHAKFPDSSEEGTWFLNSLTRYLNKHGQNLELKSSTQHDFVVELRKMEELGLALEFIMTNRSVNVELQIVAYYNESEDSSAKSVITFNSECSTGLEPVQGGPHIPEADPKKNIEVFHVHGHFDEITEGICIGLHEATIKYLRSLGYDIHHYVPPVKVHWEKNGPHDKWSWEIQIKSFMAMAHAVAFVIANRQEGLYHPFHCRTHDVEIKNEYNDHAFRMGWIGEKDPQPLDIDFFKHW